MQNLKNNDYQWDKYLYLRNEVLSMVRKSKQNYKEKITSQIFNKAIPPGEWLRISKPISKFSIKKKKKKQNKQNQTKKTLNPHQLNQIVEFLYTRLTKSMYSTNILQI